MSEALSYSRVHIEILLSRKVAVVFDFAFGEYIATKSFFEQLSDIQEQMITSKDGKIKLGSGIEADINTTGGLIAVQIHMETLDSMRQAMSGLAKLGLSVEKQIWKNI